MLIVSSKKTKNTVAIEVVSVPKMPIELKKQLNQRASDRSWKVIVEGERKSSEEIAEEQYWFSMDGKRFREAVSNLNDILEKIEDPELRDYIIITSKCFGEPEPEELKLIKQYEAKFGFVEKIIDKLEA